MATLTIPNRPVGTDVRAIASVIANFDAITSFVNNRQIDANNLADSFLDQVGVSNTAGRTRSGFRNISASESTGSTNYVKLTTQDSFTIYVPANGLVELLYQASWQSSVAGAGRAAIFVDGTQYKVAAIPSPLAQEAGTPNGTLHAPLATYPGGLVCDVGSTGVDYTGDMSAQGIGAIAGGLGFVGGRCIIRGIGSAGNHEISVRFRATSGTVTAVNRFMWVRSQSY